MARAGYALPRRDRERGDRRKPGGAYQEPPQRGRAAEENEAEATRAAAGVVQGRGARSGASTRASARNRTAPALPRPRPRGENPRGHHPRTPAGVTRGGQHRGERDEGGRLVLQSVAELR